mgnify:CR=1 FL=1
MRQIANAIAPSNFVLTNPELLRETLSLQRREPRARHAHAGRGHRGRAAATSRSGRPDAGKFEVGRNLAVTPGKVDLPERPDAAHPVRADDRRRCSSAPLLIVPPWINKFYILDLTPEKSFIKWCVDQGLTVFVISWVNPDAQLADEDLRGLHARRAARRARRDRAGDRREQGQRDRLLRRRHAAWPSRSPRWRRSATSASRRRPSSPRRSTSPMPGDLKVFVDEEQIARARAPDGRARLSRQPARWRTPSTCCARTT